MADESLGRLQDKQVALEKQKVALEEIGTSKREILKLEQELLDIQSRIAAKQSDTTQKFITDLEREKKSLKERNDELERAEKVSESFDANLQKTIKTLTGVTGASDTLIGSFANMAKGQKTLGGIFNETKKSFDKAISGQKIGISIVQKLVEGTLLLAKANDSAMASFNGATGAGGRYNKQIIELEKE